MVTDEEREAEILQTWRKNGRCWSTAIRDREIKSRVNVTDDAVVDAIVGMTPRRVLDIGCGEGWLARRLAEYSIQVLGIDAEASLIDDARAAGGDFLLLPYDGLASSSFYFVADVVVANFSLLGRESVQALLRDLGPFLSERGTLVIQTLHPVVSGGELPYRDGWREGSWSGFSADFSDPAPWYFRTIQSWVNLVQESGFRLLDIREPVDPSTDKPASLILIAMIRNHTPREKSSPLDV